MIDLSFFTTFQIGWLNAWIPAFAMVLTQLVYMAIYKEGGNVPLIFRGTPPKIS